MVVAIDLKSLTLTVHLFSTKCNNLNINGSCTHFKLPHPLQLSDIYR